MSDFENAVGSVDVTEVLLSVHTFQEALSEACSAQRREEELLEVIHRLKEVIEDLEEEIEEKEVTITALKSNNSTLSAYVDELELEAKLTKPGQFYT